MPRQARVIVPGFPHHIVQRGHNRQPVFVERRDFEYYLANLQEWKQVYELGGHGDFQPSCPNNRV